MLVVGAVGAAVLLLSLLLLAVWPPDKAPIWWRRRTRPLRKVVRPGHYRERAGWE